MTTHIAGTREGWLATRLRLLKEEKELTRRNDELARRRQQLPWLRTDKEYVFDIDEGEQSLRELVYHFMFGPTWSAGCATCTLHAESFDRAIIHLNQRDVNMVCASRGPARQAKRLQATHGLDRPLGVLLEERFQL